MKNMLLGSYKRSFLNGGVRFDCCSWHNECQMGRKCVHVKDDPDYAELCNCYERHKKKLEDYEDCSDFMHFDKSGQGFLI